MTHALRPHFLPPVGVAFDLNGTDPLWPPTALGPPELLRPRLRRHGFLSKYNIVIETEYETPDHNVYAICHCRCGSVFKAKRIHIMRNGIAHCGCRSPAPPYTGPRLLPNGDIDYTGHVHGLLYVDYPTHSNTVPIVVNWHVTCACGMGYVVSNVPMAVPHCGSRLCAMLYARRVPRKQAVRLLQDVNYGGPA